MIDNVENWASHLSNKSTLDKTGLIMVDYSRKTFLILLAMTLEASLESALTKEIGLQFSKYIRSLYFLSINVIIACFCEVDISPKSKEQLKAFIISSSTELQNIL